jgi:hypothetical protein
MEDHEGISWTAEDLIRRDGWIDYWNTIVAEYCKDRNYRIWLRRLSRFNRMLMQEPKDFLDKYLASGHDCERSGGYVAHEHKSYLQRVHNNQ